MSKATRLPYDKTIKVGDIVTAYQKGYWRVLNIEQRDNFLLGKQNFVLIPLSRWN